MEVLERFVEDEETRILYLQRLDYERKEIEKQNLLNQTQQELRLVTITKEKALGAEQWERAEKEKARAAEQKVLADNEIAKTRIKEFEPKLSLMKNAKKQILGSPFLH